MALGLHALRVSHTCILRVSHSTAVLHTVLLCILDHIKHVVDRRRCGWFLLVGAFNSSTTCTVIARTTIQDWFGRIEIIMIRIGLGGSKS